VKYCENGINIYVDSIKVDTIEGSGTFSIGKAIVKDIYTVSKNNIISQVTGENNKFDMYIDSALIQDCDELDSKINTTTNTRV
jgi:hypothetical protein